MLRSIYTFRALSRAGKINFTVEGGMLRGIKYLRIHRLTDKRRTRSRASRHLHCCMAALSNVQSTASRNSRNTVVKLRPCPLEFVSYSVWRRRIGRKGRNPKKCQGGFYAQEGVWRLFVNCCCHRASRPSHSHRVNCSGHRAFCPSHRASYNKEKKHIE